MPEADKALFLIQFQNDIMQGAGLSGAGLEAFIEQCVAELAEVALVNPTD